MHRYYSILKQPEAPRVEEQLTETESFRIKRKAITLTNEHKLINWFKERKWSKVRVRPNNKCQHYLKLELSDCPIFTKDVKRRLGLETQNIFAIVLKHYPGEGDFRVLPCNGQLLSIGSDTDMEINKKKTRVLRRSLITTKLVTNMVTVTDDICDIVNGSNRMRGVRYSVCFSQNKW